MAIEQIYYTHCTYGTSAIDRRRGDLENRARGYSARAASVPQDQLRNWKEKIARVISYRLPEGYSKEEIRALQPREAPRQLIFLPKVDESSASGGRLQLLAQVSHRPEDTSNRAGSYFAHVILNVNNGNGSNGRWTSRECLQLWGAPQWVEADSDDIGYELDSLRSMDDLRGIAWEPVIGDQLLLRFLVDDAAEPAADSEPYAMIVPRRWREKPSAQRRQLVETLLRAFFKVTLSSSQSAALLIVAEPAFAALLFFAVSRLLPEGLLTDDIDFSTYEPDPQRLRTRLAATFFRNSQEEDLGRQVYSSEKFALNTFNAAASELTNKELELKYPELVLGMLSEAGVWHGVDALLADFSRLIQSDRQPGKPRSAQLKAYVAQLEELTRATLLAPRLLSDGGSAEQWEHWTSGKRYLEQQVRQQLAKLAEKPSQWKRLADDPQRLMSVLNLISTDHEPSEAVDALIERLWRDGILIAGDEKSSTGAAGPYPQAESAQDRSPGGAAATDARREEDARVVRVLTLPDVVLRLQKKLLSLYVHDRRRLPEGSGFLWESAKHAALMAELLAEQPEDVVESLFEQLDRKHHRTFCLLLADACTRQPGSPDERIAGLRPKFVARLETPLVYDLLRIDAARFMKGYPKEDAALARHLGAILQGLPAQPDDFIERLRVLREHVGYLPPSGRERVAAWTELSKRFHELRDLQREHSSSLLKSKFKRGDLHEQIYEQIVPIIGNFREGIEDDDAPPPATQPGHSLKQPSARDLARCLWSIGESVIAAQIDLPDGFHEDLVKYFAGQPSKLSRRHRSQPKARERRGLYAAVVFLVLAGAAVAIGVTASALKGLWSSAPTSPVPVARNDVPNQGEAHNDSGIVQSTAPRGLEEPDVAEIGPPAGDKPPVVEADLRENPSSTQRVPTQQPVPANDPATPAPEAAVPGEAAAADPGSAVDKNAVAVIPDGAARTTGASPPSPRPREGYPFEKLLAPETETEKIAEVVEGPILLPTPSKTTEEVPFEVLLAMQPGESYPQLRLHGMKLGKDDYFKKTFNDKTFELQTEPVGMDRLLRVRVNREIKLCEFQLTDDALRFRWLNAKDNRHVDLLRLCVLELYGLGVESRYLSLLHIDTYRPQQFELSTNRLTLAPPLDKLPYDAQPYLDELRIYAGRLGIGVDRYAGEILISPVPDGGVPAATCVFRSIKSLSAAGYAEVKFDGRRFLRMEFTSADPELQTKLANAREFVSKARRIQDDYKSAKDSFKKGSNNSATLMSKYNSLRLKLGLGDAAVDFEKDRNSILAGLVQFDAQVKQELIRRTAMRDAFQKTQDDVEHQKEELKHMQIVGVFGISRKMNVEGTTIVVPMLSLPAAQASDRPPATNAAAAGN